MHPATDAGWATGLAAEKQVSGHLLVYRGRRGDLIKVVWWDGQGAFTERTPGQSFSQKTQKGRKHNSFLPLVWSLNTGRSPEAEVLTVQAFIPEDYKGTQNDGH